MLLQVRRWLVDRLAVEAEQPHMRTRPGQAVEAAHWVYAPTPNLWEAAAAYAYVNWLSTAINRMAEMFMTAELEVRSRKDATIKKDDHPLLDLIGRFGQPNDAQDSLEFLEQHSQMFDTYGNAYWFWWSARGGSPEAVYLLDPKQVRVIPGTQRTVEAYEYDVSGHTYRLAPEQVTHFRRPAPDSVYYGRPVSELLMSELLGDRSMSLWNNQFFTTGVPSGILIVPQSTSRESMERLEEDMQAKHSEQRRVAVMRAEAGSVAYYDAALKHHELDFKDGRLLSRQAVFDALGFHVGMVSEASTEAHARVAERRVLHSVWARHIRTASRLNSVLGFWPGASRYAVQFKDVRPANWQEESMKLKALGAYMTVDEVRAQELGLGRYPREDQEEVEIAAPESGTGS